MASEITSTHNLETKWGNFTVNTQPKPDLVIVNADCYTFDKDLSTKGAVAVRDGEILATGSTEEVLELKGLQTKEINGQGKVLIPGFIDSHTHFAELGVEESKYLDLSECKSKKELVKKVTNAAAKKQPGEWLIGVGWDESNWERKARIMDKDELDSYREDIPIALRRVDGHICCVNSKALDKINIDPSTEGFQIKEGEPTGRLMEQARIPLRQEIQPTQDDFSDGIQAASKIAFQRGITAINEAGIDNRQFQTYQRLHQKQELKVRTTLYFDHDLLESMIHLCLQTGFGDEWLRIGGVKFLADGSIGARTAWMNNEYLDDSENKGFPIWDTKTLQEKIDLAHDNNIQTATHAIGDRAIDQVVGCLENATCRAKKTLRHRIEHFEVPSQIAIEKMKEFGFVASMQPNFVRNWGGPDGMYKKRLPPEKFRTMDPFNLLIRKNIPLSFGSDCMPIGPLYGVSGAVNASLPDQRLEPFEAILCYTRNAAYAGFNETFLGSIEPGKKADFALLDQDPFKPETSLESVEPLFTMVDGEIVFERSGEVID